MSMKKPGYDIPLTADELKAAGENYTITPLYEKTVFDETFVKNYSLANNKDFANKLKEFTHRNYEQGRPGQEQELEFPSARDIHFYNQNVCRKPSASTFRRTNVKKTMKMGPGVDALGQMPIPNEFFFKRSPTVKEKEQNVKKTKTERIKKELSLGNTVVKNKVTDSLAKPPNK